MQWMIYDQLLGVDYSSIYIYKYTSSIHRISFDQSTTISSWTTTIVRRRHGDGSLLASSHLWNARPMERRLISGIKHVRVARQSKLPGTGSKKLLTVNAQGRADTA